MKTAKLFSRVAFINYDNNSIAELHRDLTTTGSPGAGSPPILFVQLKFLNTLSVLFCSLIVHNM